jgi:3-dehydroquinate synthase
LRDWVRRSIRTKTSITEKDFHERNIRKALNFGHTIGHAVESFFLKKGVEFLHGEAVAVGMICETYLSAGRFAWKPHVLEQITSCLRPFTQSIKLDETDYGDILEDMKADKKIRENRIRFSLLEAPGKPALDQLVDPDWLVKSLDYYNLS